MKIPDEFQIGDLHKKFGSYIGVADFLNGLCIAELAVPTMLFIDADDTESCLIDSTGFPIAWDAEFGIINRPHNGTMQEFLVMDGHDGPGGPPDARRVKRILFDDDIVVLIPM